MYKNNRTLQNYHCILLQNGKAFYCRICSVEYCIAIWTDFYVGHIRFKPQRYNRLLYCTVNTAGYCSIDMSDYCSIGRQFDEVQYVKTAIYHSKAHPGFATYYKQSSEWQFEHTKINILA